MKRIVLSVLLLAPAAVFAASAFDGTWKARLDSIKVTGKPDVFLIANGNFSCTSCDPPIDKLPADGAWHKLPGHAYFDEMMVRVVDARTVETSQRQGGKLMGVNTMTVSADGNTAAGKFTGYSGTQPTTGSYTEKRVAPGPSGAHPLSGSWLQDQLSNANDATTVVQYAMTPEQFSMQSNGQSYQAKFDGKQYPVTGDPGNTQVVLKKINVRTVHETDYRQGKIVDQIDLVAAGDGKSILLTDKDVAHGQTTTMILDKQP
jgi:hypothetical protein